MKMARRLKEIGSLSSSATEVSVVMRDYHSTPTRFSRQYASVFGSTDQQKAGTWVSSFLSEKLSKYLEYIATQSFHVVLYRGPRREYFNRAPKKSIPPKPLHQTVQRRPQREHTTEAFRLNPSARSSKRALYRSPIKDTSTEPSLSALHQRPRKGDFNKAFTMNTSSKPSRGALQHSPQEELCTEALTPGIQRIPRKEHSTEALGRRPSTGPSKRALCRRPLMEHFIKALTMSPPLRPSRGGGHSNRAHAMSTSARARCTEYSPRMGLHCRSSHTKHFREVSSEKALPKP